MNACALFVVRASANADARRPRAAQVMRALTARALFVVLASANALTPGALAPGNAKATSLRLRRPSASLTRLRCCSVAGADDNSEQFSASDLSSVLAKYDKPGFRVRQSGPMRRVFEVRDIAQDKADDMLRWLRRAAATPWIRLMAMLGVAFMFQRSSFGAPLGLRKLTRILMFVTIVWKMKKRGFTRWK